MYFHRRCVFVFLFAMMAGCSPDRGILDADWAVTPVDPETYFTQEVSGASAPPCTVLQGSVIETIRYNKEHRDHWRALVKVVETHDVEKPHCPVGTAFVVPYEDFHSALMYRYHYRERMRERAAQARREALVSFPVTDE